MTAVAKTTYSADMLLRLRTAPGVSGAPPNFEGLPDSCKSLFACLNDAPAITVVRHTKQSDTSGDSVWNVSSSTEKPTPKRDLGADDRERLLSIRQTFTSRLGGTRLNATAVDYAAADLAHKNSKAAVTQVVAVSKKAKAAAPAAAAPAATAAAAAADKKFSGWSVTGRAETAQEFYAAVPAAPVSRAEQRRTQSNKRGATVSPAPTTAQSLNRRAPAFNSSKVAPAQPTAAAGTTVPTMDPAEWYAWWLTQASSANGTMPIDQNGNIIGELPAQSRGTRRAKRNNNRGTAPADATDAPVTETSPKTDLRSDEATAEDADGDAETSKGRGRRGGLKHRRKVEERRTKTPSNKDTSNAVNPATVGKAAAPVEDASDDDDCRDTRCRPAAITESAKERRTHQRERQVALGTRTLGYLVMEHMAARGMTVHPESFPPPTGQPCSKRSWDGQMRRWRQRLHLYDEHAADFMSPQELAAHTRNRRAQEKEEEELALSTEDEAPKKKPTNVHTPQASRPTVA